jgi:hypothetical protein
LRNHATCKPNDNSTEAAKQAAEDELDYYARHGFVPDYKWGGKYV